MKLFLLWLTCILGAVARDPLLDTIDWVVYKPDVPEYRFEDFVVEPNVLPDYVRQPGHVYWKCPVPDDDDLCDRLLTGYQNPPMDESPREYDIEHAPQRRMTRVCFAPQH